MLVVDYKHRLTVNQCLSHEFISPQSSPRKESRLRSMSSISSMSEVLLSQHIDSGQRELDTDQVVVKKKHFRGGRGSVQTNRRVYYGVSGSRSEKISLDSFQTNFTLFLICYTPLLWILVNPYFWPFFCVQSYQSITSIGFLPFQMYFVHLALHP